MKPAACYLRCLSANISYSEVCLFVLLMVSYAVQKLSSLMWSHSFIFAFNFLAPEVKFIKSSGSISLVPMFSSMQFVVWSFIFRSLIHFELFLVYGDRQQSSFVLLHVAFQFSQHQFLKRLSFLHCMFLALLTKIICSYICGFISGLSILFNWSVCLFLPIPRFDYCLFVV